LFKSGGTLDGYVSALAPAMDTAMKGNLAPLQGFLDSVGAAVHTIGSVFKISALADFSIPKLLDLFGGGTSGGGAPGGSAHPAGQQGGGGPPGGLSGGRGASAAVSGALAGANLTDIQGMVSPFTLPGDWNDLATLLFDDTESGIASLFAQYATQVASPPGGVAGAVAGIPPPTGEWANVVADGMGFIGQTMQPNGVPWDGWCEKFVNDMDVMAGYGARRHGTAYLHAIDGPLYTSPPPAGASVYFDQSWGSAGHTAIATGSGATVVTTPIADGIPGIHYADIIGARGYMGWKPPGLATGGVTYGGNPQMVVVGDGPSGEREFHFPEPELRDVIRSEGAGMTFGDINIHLAHGATYEDGKQAATGFLDEMRRRGMNPR
jgi:hypothetical protein